jgi:hypothetical protein
MGKVWVLETHTKGTGANMVPLDKEHEKGTSAKEPQFAVPQRREPANEPAPKAPPRFKVVEVMSHRVLAEDASTRVTVDLLRDVHSVVDVAISLWSEKDGRWRLLTHGEQKRLWDLRDAAARPPRQAASAQP